MKQKKKAVSKKKVQGKKKSRAPTNKSKTSKAPATFLGGWRTHFKQRVKSNDIQCLEEAQELDASSTMKDLASLIESHYLEPTRWAKRLKRLGRRRVAVFKAEVFPRTARARSGDLGECLAVEFAERDLGFSVPVRRLRFKDGREMALRGDDVIGVKLQTGRKPVFLKGEAKSRKSLTPSVIKEAAAGLDGDRGLPNRHTMLFLADRLYEAKDDELAELFEDTLSENFKKANVRHLLFAFCGSAAEKNLSSHLDSYNGPHRRYAIAVRVKKHSEFVKKLYEAIS